MMIASVSLALAACLSPVPASPPSVVDSANEAGFDIFRRAYASSGGNVMISPLSISMCLAMVEVGATGDTKTAIDRAFRWDGFATDATALPSAMNRLNTDLSATAKETLRMQIANSIWLNKSLPVKPAFVSGIQQSFGADTANLDFSDRAGTLKRINGWVNEKTYGKIPSIIDDITPMSLMVLVNAVSFKAQWLSQFRKEATEELPFAAETGSVKAQMMINYLRTPYLKQNDVELVAIPYKDGPYQMIVMLPPKGTRLADFVKGLTTTKFGGWMQAAKYEFGSFSIPKWKSDYELELNQALKGMGMEIAFDPKRASFKNMTDMPAWISRVIHKTFIAVDEQGTEAAAVTAVEMRAGSAPPRDPFEFVADRPFVYAIWNSENRLVCFLGTVAKP